MKTNNPSRISQSIFKQDSGEHSVRLIKASQTGSLFQDAGHSHGEAHAHAGTPKKHEIRLISTGPDYCDLEVTCGCGETTQVRCWNTPSAAK